MKAFPLVFAVLGAISFSSSVFAARVSLERLEASVNSNIILRSDIRQFRKTLPLRAQLDPLFAGTPVGQAGLAAKDDDIVQYLIDERIITQLFPVTDSEVEQEINSIQASNKINRESLRNALQEQGFDFENYFELIRVSASKRNLIDRDIRTKVTISNDDIRNYFYNHYAKGSTVPSSYRVGIITVSPSSYKTPAAARTVALRAREDLRKGEAFEEVAKRVSDHPTRESGGDLGMVTEDQMNPAIREQLKKLKVGEVSEIFGSAQTAWFILKLTEIGALDDSRLKKMSDEIRAQLSAREYQRQIGLWLERQRQLAFVHRLESP